ncbi:hypothetical protein BaRGS_00024176, partial [Batillaria attramentaria]
GGSGSVRSEGLGPFHNNAAWKGMGPGRCPTSPPAQPNVHPIPTRLLLLVVFFCGFAWTSGVRFLRDCYKLVARHATNAPTRPSARQHFTREKSLTTVPTDHKEQGNSASRFDKKQGNAFGRGFSRCKRQMGSRSNAQDQKCLPQSRPTLSARSARAGSNTRRTYLNCITSTKNSSRGCHGDIGFNSVRSGVRNQLKQYRCSMEGPTLDTSDPVTPQPPYQCRYHAKEFRVCGMFGDPHLRTFGAEFQTCKVKGAWPLVNNKYLIVQVTNDPVEGVASDATATSKLTVIVKSDPECGSEQYHTYQAQTDDLPSSFDDGNTSYGPHASLELVEVQPNKHVEIHIRYIATKVIVRQIGRYFTFAIRMPDAIVNTSRSRSEPELCTKGCPLSERIDYQQFLAQRKNTVTKYQTEASRTYGAGVATMSQQEAEVMCRESGLVGFYFDSCVFDLMATGDTNFTMAALHSLKDVLRLDPAINVTDGGSFLSGSPSGASAALSRTQSWSWHVICACVLLVTFWQHDLMAHRWFRGWEFKTRAGAVRLSGTFTRTPCVEKTNEPLFQQRMNTQFSVVVFFQEMTSYSWASWDTYSQCVFD